ncbi:MAG TPA: hypothetical protein VGC60_13785, partial [Pyrinomonadaceae bacterium]
ARAIRILQSESGLDEHQAETFLDEANGNLPVALVMSQTGRSRAEAESALTESRGVISAAIDSLKLR